MGQFLSSSRKYMLRCSGAIAKDRCAEDLKGGESPCSLTPLSCAERVTDCEWSINQRAALHVRAGDCPHQRRLVYLWIGNPATNPGLVEVRRAPSSHPGLLIHLR